MRSASTKDCSQAPGIYGVRASRLLRFRAVLSSMIGIAASRALMQCGGVGSVATEWLLPLEAHSAPFWVDEATIEVVATLSLGTIPELFGLALVDWVQEVA